MGVRVFTEYQTGEAIPAGDPHAISVTLATTKDTIEYEEGRLNLNSGYPRFLQHQFCRALDRRLKRVIVPSSNGVLTAHPSLQAAKMCVAYAGAGQAFTTDNDISISIVPKTHMQKVGEFLQHTGLRLSSRHAESVLKEHNTDDNEDDIYRILRERIALFANHSPIDGNPDIKPDDVFLYPTGMTSIFFAHQMIKSVKPGKTIQFGFPYVDTLKIQQKFNHYGCTYVSHATEQDFAQLESEIKNGDISTIYCEAPGNPTLKTPDLRRLRDLCDRYGIILVIDDTIGGWANVDVTPFADIIVTSLTKSFSGGCKRNGWFTYHTTVITVL